MKITEIQQKYPHAKYYKLKDFPNKAKFVIEKIEDFFDLTDIIGYYELQIGEDEASDIVLESLIEAYSQSKDSWNNLETLLFKELFNYVKDNMSNKLRSIIKVKSYTITSLFGINLDIMFEDSNDCTIISDEKFRQGLFEIDKIYMRRKEEFNKREEELNKIKEARTKEIENYILQFKAKYLEKQTKKDKEEWIQMVQLELKNKLNVDARGDYRASKTYIKKLFDGE